MKPLSLNVLRKKYLDFFVSKGHLCLDSFPLVPKDDNSLLLINAGMAPFKRFFTGEQVPPSKRVTTCQKCVRTLDIDNVGKTARHGTFFEMLGNFSFGDYFKEEAIPWAWEFLTKTLEIPENRLYPSIYVEDDEAFDIWVKNGVSADKVVKLGKEDNFWEIGAGPCGPCSEIYFDRGEKYGCGKPDCKVGCDCDRFIEVWNIVFTQFDSDGNGNYTRLANPNIDTGMGLERLACIMQDVGNLFEVDTIRNIMHKVCEIAGIEYTSSENNSDVSLRVITDHIRTATFLIGDGVIPSNEGRGYILRRVLRRAARHGKLLGITRPFLSELCDTTINESCDAYPELNEKRDYIKKTVSVEEERFRQTIDAGLNILDGMISEVEKTGKGILSGQEVFKLYDTFGFPIDLTKEITSERGIEVDEEGFDALMKQQKQRARDARASLGDMGWSGDELAFIDRSVKTEFTGYNLFENDCEIITILKDGEPVSELSGGKAVILLDKTPFYAESGGQVADTGEIITASGVFLVEDTQKTHEGQFLHFGHMKEGVVSLGNALARINSERRRDIMRNHSSVHILQAALRKVLGAHVEQAGSYVDDKRARFDFTHFSAMTSEEISEVERIVNDEILKGETITVKELPIAEAKAEGAMALFGEKYSDIVRLVKMGDFSAELCGGTHLTNTSRAGMFKIISESSVAAGVRRIEAITGRNTIDFMNHSENTLNSVKNALKANNVSDLPERAQSLQDEVKHLKKELDRANPALVLAKIKEIYEKSKEIHGTRLVTYRFDNIPSDALRTAADVLADKHKESVCLLATVIDGKVLFVAGCGKTAISLGAHAGNLLKAVSPIVGGGGGGRPDSATSGGRDATRLDEALEASAAVLEKQLSK